VFVLTKVSFWVVYTSDHDVSRSCLQIDVDTAYSIQLAFDATGIAGCNSRYINAYISTFTNK
jgi:hypothetical protein